MPTTLISSPYYLGHRDRGMGAGPTRLLDEGVASAVGDVDDDVTTVIVQPADPTDHEVGATFATARAVAVAVAGALRDGRFPIVLSGNCASCVGTLGGLGGLNVGVTWFDAHGDFHSPDTTGSGFFDGMGLHLATGGSWRRMAATVPGFRPVPERNVLLAGVRDLDDGEEDLLDESGVVVVPLDRLTPERIGQDLVPYLDTLAGTLRDLYVHIDLDVLSPETAPANEYQPDGGFTLDDLRESLRRIGDRFQVRAAALTCYDPAVDPDGRGARAGVEVVRALAEIGWPGP